MLDCSESPEGTRAEGQTGTGHSFPFVRETNERMAPLTHQSQQQRQSENAPERKVSPLTEGVQAGQHFGVVVAVQTYAADQELLVDLADHRAGNSGAFAGHPRAPARRSVLLRRGALRKT